MCAEDIVASFFVGTNFPKYSRYFGKAVRESQPPTIFLKYSEYFKNHFPEIFQIFREMPSSKYPEFFGKMVWSATLSKYPGYFGKMVRTLNEVVVSSRSRV